MSDESIQSYLEETIVCENSPVTVKGLSKEMDISRVEAIKQMTEFMEVNSVSKGLTATYFVTGIDNKGTMKMMILPETNVRKAKIALNEYTQHIYSVQTGDLEDTNILFGLDMQRESKIEQGGVEQVKQAINDDIKRLTISYPNFGYRSVCSQAKTKILAGPSIVKQETIAKVETHAKNKKTSPIKEALKRHKKIDNNGKNSGAPPALEGISKMFPVKTLAQKETEEKSKAKKLTELKKCEEETELKNKLKKCEEVKKEEESPKASKSRSRIISSDDDSPVKSPPPKRNKLSNTILSQKVFNEDLFCSQEDSDDDFVENNKQPIKVSPPKSPPMKKSRAKKKDSQKNSASKEKKSEKGTPQCLKDVSNEGDDTIIKSTPPTRTKIWHKTTVTKKDDDGFMVVQAMSVPVEKTIEQATEKKAPPKKMVVPQVGHKKQASISSFFSKK